MGRRCESSWRAMASAMAVSVASTEARAWGCSRAPATPTRGITSGSWRARPSQQIEGSGVLPEEVRGQLHQHMATGEHLPSGQLPVRREHLSEHAAHALQRQLRQRPDLPAAVSMASVNCSTGHPIDANSPRQRATNSPSTPCSLAWRVVRAATARACKWYSPRRWHSADDAPVERRTRVLRSLSRG